jgi:deazaflavin-dependent oxidoreductase (nitroreductase family)
MPVLARIVRRLGHRRGFAAVMSRVLPIIDRGAYRASGHRGTVTQMAFPTLLLRLPGRKDAPLLYLRDGGGYLVAATNWGRTDHPGWSTRLLRDPQADILLGRHSQAVVAERLDEDSLSAAWPRLVELWPAFETYRRRSARHVRVFRLIPR